MLNSLSEETFELDFIKLFIKVKILLFSTINKTKISDINIILNKYVDILDLEKRKFDPFLIKNFIVLDNLLKKNLKKEFDDKCVIINFKDTFYISSILYITNKINNIVKIIHKFEDLKIKLLKLKNSLSNIEIKSRASFNLILKSVFSKNDSFVINFNSETEVYNSKLVYIIQQLYFINNTVSALLKDFSKFNVKDILFLMDSIYRYFIKTENLFISLFYIFKYLKIMFNLFIFITQLK